MPRIERDREIAQRRQRKEKLKKLIRRYMATANSSDKTTIAAKIRRISPFYDVEARVAELKELAAAK